jgi:hypothetical protein
MPARVALIAAALLMAACRPPALEYAPPPQRVLPQGAEAGIPMFVRVSEPNVEKHVVQDVLSDQPGSAWRWTNAHPRLKVLLDGELAGAEFVVEFTVPDVVLKKVGPLGIKFVVNDRVVGSGRYAREGKQEFRTPVTPEMLTNRDQAVFGFDVDPVYVADDGVKLAVLLEAIGFRPSAAK